MMKAQEFAAAVANAKELNRQDERRKALGLPEIGAKAAKETEAIIAEAVAKAVLSHQTLEREQKLRADRVTSEKDLQQAEAEHRAACQQLRMLGFTEEQIGWGWPETESRRYWRGARWKYQVVSCAGSAGGSKP